uniref:C2H2-type domain-containing protein n=1 Tax=Neogobius melanostomus TaxID=47308 RepID=A0A8C6WLI4_9GOBI
MSPGQLLRSLVTARLTAAAEEICELFDKTIAEYMEELGRSKEENQRKQRLLDSFLNPRLELVRVSAHIPSTCRPGPDLTQNTTLTEQSTRQEEQLPSNESTGNCAKREESPPPHQRQAEHREETQKEDIGSECKTQTLNSSDMDEDANWVRPLSSAECSETEADGDEEETSLLQRRAPWEDNGVMLDADGGAECQTCKTQRDLRVHSRVRTGGRPFSCSVCVKTFDRRSHLLIHQRIHKKPYRCSLCNKRFSQKGNRDQHKRTHTGEKPFSCRVCDKAFNRRSNLNAHERLSRRRLLPLKAIKHKACTFIVIGLQELVIIIFVRLPTHTWKTNLAAVYSAVKQ